MSDPLILRPGGVEYVKWAATGLPANPPVGSVQVSLDGGVTWHAATVDAGQIQLLVAHPSVTEPGTAAVAVIGVKDMCVRLTDTPEVVIRDAGRLFVKG